MKSKNHAPLTDDDREHIDKVKKLPCSVCNAPGPSDAHHIKQQRHRTVVALCRDCHQGKRNGWHGERLMWSVYKLDEIDALNITLSRLA